MTLEELYSKDIIVFDCLSGSHAYGLATPESDVDIKGVYILPEEDYFSLNYVEQVSNKTNDIVYYELKRFVELLSKSNPNILELLYTPNDSVRKLHPAFEKLRSMNLLSKQCKESFGGYAMTQVRKAKGLNKKILNPVEKERKGVLDFCFVAHDQGSIPVREFLEMDNLEQSKCGLSRIPHMHEMYGLYYGETSFKGIARKENANEVSLSSIPKGIQPFTVMSFNKSAYSKYCKDYKEYWEWVEKRNDTRYQNTLDHGQNYDAKNMMHTIRLLTMCEEIGLEGQLNVRREDRDYLLGIKKGAFLYEELVEIAESKIASINDVYEKCALPDQPDIHELNKVLIEIRREFYRSAYK
ncbi:hypothetical protein GCM10011506_47140 [Marivirga lumbricoides]|uniref:Nucleotidyltransferase n=1 Tax=Marivirga lumbricoides TaxID=1046115 RepID=A0ABQ1N7M9_9BACT|nr:hypothetical protein GCM10011506_47140 [Marivirga lumbricoides]